jgi:hypothetical protein
MPQRLSQRARTQARILAWKRLALWVAATSMTVIGAGVLMIMLFDLRGSISTDSLGLTSYRGYHGQPLGLFYSLSIGVAMSFVGIALLRRLFKSKHTGYRSDDAPS